MGQRVHIAVIGGGAAGMMAAIIAARLGARVTICERQERVGRKILSTGNGRCNFTNVSELSGHYHGEDPDFFRSALGRFSVQKTIGFFKALGVCTRVEENGRVFPLTGQASTILDVLRYETERVGVCLRLKAEVQNIARHANSFVLRLSEGEEEVDRVVVATGGKAAPSLGGTESGITLLKKLGHKAVSLFPALVPLKAEPHFGARAKGVKVMARVRLVIAECAGEAQEGEILFTEYGLSGPPVIELSHRVNRAQRHQPVFLELDLFPSWSVEDLERDLGDRFSSRPETPLDRSLLGLVHKRLIPVVLQQVGITSPWPRAGQTSPGTSLRIAGLLKHWRFAITGSLSWNDAQVMGGGISTKDFFPDTLESRLVKGLFAAGEVLDVTGDCGGYNLQWAWSSGYVAGLQSAAV